MFGWTLVWLLCYFLLSILPAAAQQRAIRPVDQIPSPANKQALVIGNSAYEHTSPFHNPANDAMAISKTLRQLGFSVETLLDVDQRQMEQSIRYFGNKLRKAKGVGLFYYAGHGMQVDGENYLLPVDISPNTASYWLNLFFFQSYACRPSFVCWKDRPRKSGKQDFNEGLQVQKVIDGAFKSDKEGIHVMIE